MAFHDSRLNEKIEYGSSGGPTFNTLIVTTDSGQEQRIGKWSKARLTYTVGLSLKKSQAKSLLAFFYARKGKLHSFPFKDWSDYSAEDQPVTTLTSSTLQMYRRYSDGGSNYDRKITKPVTSTITVKRNGVSYTDFTVNRLTGVITLTGLTTGTFTWSGEYDVPVRFDTDEANINIEDFDIRTWTGIPIVEVFE